MRLTDETRIKLRELIQNKFTEQQLKDICTENRQTLQGNIYDLVEGNTYKSKLINLVTYLEQNGLLDELLRILRHENQSFNSEIQSLIDQNNISNIVSDIANYLFFIIEPKPNTNKEFFIKSEFVQFENNECEKERNRFPITIKLREEEEEELRSYLEKEIIDYVYKSIQEMKKELKKRNIRLDSLPIIELFVPISLLGADFDIKKIPDEYGSQKIPICNLYPLIVRSYERFFKRDINDQSIILYREKFRSLQDTNNTQNVCYLIHFFRDSKERREIFQKILREGFPLCLWTRYTDKTIDNTTVSKNFGRILDIDSGSHHNYWKFYRIHRNIHDIRKNNMKKKTDFGYNLGVLFDHDKIPTGANQLMSPNMARNV